MATIETYHNQNLQRMTRIQQQRDARQRGPSDSDLVFKTRKWDRLLYGEYREASSTIREVEGAGSDRSERYPDFVREVFTRMYRPSTERLPDAADGAQWAEKLHDVAEGLPEFEQLRARTRGDQMYSGMAASALCDKAVAAMKPTESNLDIERMKKRLAGLQAMHDQLVDQMGDKPNPFGDRVKQAEEDLKRADAEAEDLANGMDASKLRGAIRAGCEAAQREINAAQQAIDSFSYGENPGTPTTRNDWQLKRQIADEVGKHEMLQKLAALAGRMRRIAATKRREKIDYAVGEISNIETGAELSRLLPTELLQLCDEDLEAQAFSRFTDRGCLQYKLTGNEELGKGAMIFCVDESASMSGDRDLWAKAVSLAGLDNAARDKRPWGYIHFDTKVSRADVITAADYKHPQKVAKLIMESMTWFTAGGTAFEPALERAKKMREEIGDLKTADIILVTDGCAPLASGFLTAWKVWQEKYPCNLITVLIGGTKAGALGEISDHVFPLQDIIDSQCGDFYDHVFAI